MSERRDIPDALRDAVERTVQATVGTRELAQGAASELSASVDELVKGAEKGLTRSRRSVRAAVEERLPATQEDMKAIRAELRRLANRLDAMEQRLADPPSTRGATGKAKTTPSRPAASTRSAAATKAKSRSAAAGTKQKSRPAAGTKKKSTTKAKAAPKRATKARSASTKPKAGTRSKPKR